MKITFIAIIFFIGGLFAGQNKNINNWVSKGTSKVKNLTEEATEEVKKKMNKPSKIISFAKKKVYKKKRRIKSKKKTRKSLIGKTFVYSKKKPFYSYNNARCTVLKIVKDGKKFGINAHCQGNTKLQKKVRSKIFKTIRKRI
jgi:hypothetical protein